MMAHRWSRGTALHFLLPRHLMGVGGQRQESADLRPEKRPVPIVQEAMFNLVPQELYDQGSSPREPLNRTLGSLHFLPGVEPRFIRLTGRSIINIPWGWPGYCPRNCSWCNKIWRQCREPSVTGFN
jgi:hypothetical protein